MKTMCNIMLIPTACGYHSIRSAYIIGMSIILCTVFTMFVDFKIDSKWDNTLIASRNVEDLNVYMLFVTEEARAEVVQSGAPGLQGQELESR